jgi:hypothetical protein
MKPVLGAEPAEPGQCIWCVEYSGVMEISEGILLVGTKSDNEFLLKSMVFTIVLVNCALQLSHHAGWGLVGVWCVIQSSAAYLQCSGHPSRPLKQ